MSEPLTPAMIEVLGWRIMHGEATSYEREVAGRIILDHAAALASAPSHALQINAVAGKAGVVPEKAPATEGMPGDHGPATAPSTIAPMLRVDAAGKLRDYPNLQAIVIGTVSGHFTEWPAMRGELLRLMASYTASATRRIPEFIDVGAEYELCRFSSGEWSLRLKQGEDRAHVRYLNKHEKGFVDAALAAMGATDGGKQT